MERYRGMMMNLMTVTTANINWVLTVRQAPWVIGVGVQATAEAARRAQASPSGPGSSLNKGLCTWHHTGRYKQLPAPLQTEPMTINQRTIVMHGRWKGTACSIQLCHSSATDSKCFWNKWLLTSSSTLLRIPGIRGSGTAFGKIRRSQSLKKLHREAVASGSLLWLSYVTNALVLIQKAGPWCSLYSQEGAISTIDYCNVLGQCSPYCYHELTPIHLNHKNKKKINNNNNEPFIHTLASLDSPA